MEAVAEALHVSCGSMLGALTRIGLGRSFGTGGANVVSDTSALFLDLPANAFGSFLAGLYAPLRSHAARVHPTMHHALSIGYFGSVTSMFCINVSVPSFASDKFLSRI
jgi:fluoride ion exporter CrcB/FEX